MFRFDSDVTDLVVVAIAGDKIRRATQRPTAVKSMGLRSRSRSRSLPSHGVIGGKAVATTLPSHCEVDPGHAVVEVAESQVDVEVDDPWLQLLQAPQLIPLAADPGHDVVEVAESQVEEDEAVDLFDRPETKEEARRQVISTIDVLQLRRELREQ